MGSDVTRGVMTSLVESVEGLRRSTDDVRDAWRQMRTTVSDIWRTMINDNDTLRNFYLNVYNDVSDVTSRAGASASYSVRPRSHRHECGYVSESGLPFAGSLSLVQAHISTRVY